MEGRTQAVDVRPVIDTARIERLFGGHVIRGAEDAAGLGQAGAADDAIRRSTAQASQPQVGHLDRAGNVAQQVGGLDVAVNHVPRVDVLQTARRLQGAIDRLGHAERAALLDNRGEIRAVDELHHQEMAGLGLVGVVGHHDVRMAQLRDGLHFALKALDERAILVETAGEHLEGDDAFHAPVAGLEDGAHAADAEFVEHVIVGDPQFLEPPVQDEFGLVGGQQSCGHQRPGQALAVGDRRFDGPCTFKIFWGKEFGLLQTMKEFLPSQAFIHLGLLHDLRRRPFRLEEERPGLYALAQ